MFKRKYIDFVIDFDGTCVEHEYPRIGKDIGAASVLKEMTDNNMRAILSTMRDDKVEQQQDGDGNAERITYPKVVSDHLTQAVNWFKDNNIPLYGIQRNPTQDEWTSSPKAYGQIIIDDAALGCPLIKEEGKRPYVDWVRVREMLVEMGLLPAKQD